MAKNENEVNPYCTSKEFKKNLSELCDKCPLVQVINDEIKKIVEPQALERKELLTKDQFEDYINKQIAISEENMSFCSQQMESSGYERSQRTRIICIRETIFSKERIKALNRIMDADKPNRLPNAEAPVLNFEDLFLKTEYKKYLFKFLRELSLTNEVNKWVVPGSQKKNAICALIAVFKEKNWIHSHLPNFDVAELIAETIGTSISETVVRESITISPTHYPQGMKKFCEAIKEKIEDLV